MIRQVFRSENSRFFQKGFEWEAAGAAPGGFEEHVQKSAAYLTYILKINFLRQTFHAFSEHARSESDTSKVFVSGNMTRVWPAHREPSFPLRER